MSHCLETKIQVVILMVRYESPVMVIHELQCQGTTNIPERHPITSICQKFLETGSLGDRAHTGRPSTIIEDKVQEIQQILDNEPVNSVRSVAREANVSRYQAHQIMRDCIGYKPHMMHSVQQLYDEDMDLRVEMSEHLTPILEDRKNDGNIFFSDESTFYISGVVNKHNCRTWAATNPFTTIEAAMNSPKVNVWCTMSNKQIISRYFFEDETVNRQNYLQILKNYFYPIIQRQRFNNKMIFQQEGAPPHFAIEVRA